MSASPSSNARSHNVVSAKYRSTWLERHNRKLAYPSHMVGWVRDDKTLSRMHESAEPNLIGEEETTVLGKLNQLQLHTYIECARQTSNYSDSKSRLIMMFSAGVSFLRFEPARAINPKPPIPGDRASRRAVQPCAVELRTVQGGCKIPEIQPKGCMYVCNTR